MDLEQYNCAISDNSLKKWFKVSLTHTIGELQIVHEVLLWASSFLLGYKNVVRPIEALVAQGEQVWT